jgi:S1-C subfamily serine protease
MFQSFIQVRKFGSARKHPAKVFFQSHECDLAVLQVDDPSFWEGFDCVNLDCFNVTFSSQDLPALTIQLELPQLQSEVVCIGYPTGGDGISTTRGVVSRIDQVDYVQGRLSRFLSIQIDAAINPGNSGGPALASNNELIGVAFQGLNDADGIGYLIPTSVLLHFFQQIKRGVAGFPSLGVSTQSADSPSIRGVFDCWLFFLKKKCF